MYSFLILPLLFLASVHCNPTQNASECTKEQLDEKNRCENTVETSSEYLLIKARLQTLIPQCIPNYQNTCLRRNDLADSCLEQLEFNAVQNQSLSSDDKRKSFQAIDNCLSSFYDEFWTIMEDKLRQRPVSGQQQPGQNGQQQQSGFNNQEQPRSNRQQRGAQQQPGQNGQQQPNQNGQQQPTQQQSGQQQPGQNGQQQSGGISSGQQQLGSNGQQQPRANRQQRGANNQQKTTHSTPRTSSTLSPTPRPTPRFARQANFEQKSNGNDQCIPNAQQFSCLIDALLQTNQMAEMGQRLLQQQRQCKNNSANCQFQANFNKQQDCSNQDLKPIVDQLKGQFQDCIANQGTKS